MKNSDKATPLPDKKYLDSILIYDPVTGVLCWRVSRSHCAKEGSQAGYINNAGYRAVKIDQKMYRVCRLVHKIMTGKDPVGEIDHINRIRHDDRWSNLRDISSSDNCRNRAAGRKHYYPCGRRWRVRLRINTKMQHIGTFDDEELAALVASEARDKFYGGIA